MWHLEISAVGKNKLEMKVRMRRKQVFDWLLVGW
jgi:hypothetical protein